MPETNPGGQLLVKYSLEISLLGNSQALVACVKVNLRDPLLDMIQGESSVNEQPKDLNSSGKFVLMVN